MASDWRLPAVQTDASKPDVAALIGAIAGQDKAAFSVLFSYFAPRVKGMLMRSGFDAARAEEVAQETLLTVWRKAALFDPTGASASAWIYTIARNLRIDVLRRDQRGSRVLNAVGQEPQIDLASPADHLMTTEAGERVRAALVCLSAEQREVVALSFFEGKAHPEISEALGIPLGTVKSRLRLAMKHLRETLDDFS
jgi:RNA polymerase sigma-70 factor, ECF subfamily